MLPQDVTVTQKEFYFTLGGEEKLTGFVCLKKFHVSFCESSGHLRTPVICFK